MRFLNLPESREIWRKTKRNGVGISESPWIYVLIFWWVGLIFGHLKIGFWLWYVTHPFHFPYFLVWNRLSFFIFLVYNEGYRIMRNEALSCGVEASKTKSCLMIFLCLCRVRSWKVLCKVNASWLSWSTSKQV